MTNKHHSDKRTYLYTFTTLRDLEEFFSMTFSRREIRKFIKYIKTKFKPRPEISAELNKLQFLKKCEWELVRKAKSLNK